MNKELIQPILAMLDFEDGSIDNCDPAHHSSPVGLAGLLPG